MHSNERWCVFDALQIFGFYGGIEEYTIAKGWRSNRWNYCNSNKQIVETWGDVYL